MHEITAVVRLNRLRRIAEVDDCSLYKVHRGIAALLLVSIDKTLSGGLINHPVKDIIVCNGEEYEVRVFLSADKTDQNYCIEKPLDYFLSKTKGKIVPIAIDSGDNYYCVNNETGKVYYWSAEMDEYYNIAQDLLAFEELFANPIASCIKSVLPISLRVAV